MDNKLDDLGMNSSFMQKLQNYWYHYKIHTIAGLFVLIFLIVCISQCAGKVSPDSQIVYIGPKTMTADNMKDLDESLSKILNKDFNEDGKIYVDYSEYTLLSESQAIEAIEDKMMYDAGFQQTVRKQVDMEITNGDCVIYLMDPSVYLDYVGDSVFMPLSEALGYELPQELLYNEDGYAFKLSELDAYKWYNGIGDLPANTLVAVKNRAIISIRESEKDKEERYSQNLYFLKQLIDYKMPEE